MHSIPSLAYDLPWRNIWAPSDAELSRAGDLILGFEAKGWLRKSGASTIVASRHLSTPGSAVSRNLADLCRRVDRILNDGQPVPGLRAATFYHLRFENIHPMWDGNGRLGRLILAKQCEQFCGQKADFVINSIHDFENEYRWVFFPEENAQRYELLIDLIARLTGIKIDQTACVLHEFLEPAKPFVIFKGQRQL